MIRIRTRILTKEQIRALPPHNLKRYRKAVLNARDDLHRSLKDWGRETPATEDEVKAIRTFDWLAARCNEEYKIKK